VTSWRIALYWAPEEHDPLHGRASAWLGRDAISGAMLPQASLPGHDIAEITADARGYGLHATLKPPFRLAGDLNAALAAAEECAAKLAPFTLPPLAVMDLGAAQDLFGRGGELTRIDVRLVAGADRAAAQTQWQALPNWPARLLVVEPAEAASRISQLSRAYRVNLTVLALVALFTGAFLVFSTQALSVLRRRPQFALLRVLGVTRRQLLTQVLLEGTLLGAAGSLLGLLLGTLLARAALSLFGGDLGGGYFPGVQPVLQIDVLAACGFFLGGSGVATLGSLSPAHNALICD
jgi:hypothetical protein